jgi:curved DNA-binding protein
LYSTPSIATPHRGAIYPKSIHWTITETMNYKDYYAVMGVPRSASDAEIKTAYRKLARKYHPDLNKEADAEKHFKEVGEAYQVLKDSEQRAAFDALGTGFKDGDEIRPRQEAGGGQGGAYADADASETPDADDFFSDLFGARGRQSARTYAPEWPG